MPGALVGHHAQGRCQGGNRRQGCGGGQGAVFAGGLQLGFQRVGGRRTAGTAGGAGGAEESQRQQAACGTCQRTSPTQHRRAARIGAGKGVGHPHILPLPCGWLAYRWEPVVNNSR